MLLIDGFRFFFFSNEHLPKHIHIEKGDAYVRIELERLEVTSHYGVSSKEMKKIVKLVKKHKDVLERGWDEYFSE